MLNLTGLYKDWYLDYASYVILERAVPHLQDGLKPVQRRILHSMKRMDDGRYNKVANIIGHTMQFHPHGDASIGNALVQLGQKELLIDTQGNWGNILTGDSAAAPRYIEARLSKFALDVVFNNKTTAWKPSYDGRNQEPEDLPIKFPLLLAQGSEGIAVGMASKFLPHNFIELIDASISCLRGEDFELYPDFPTGGMADCSKYNHGIRGGRVKIRARIEKRDKKTLAITEIPFGTNTSGLIASIISANDKGKIKIKKVDDNTAAQAEIIIQLANDVSPDKTIDALYAFTSCEVSISPNSCVINNSKPQVLSVEDILRCNTGRTKDLLQKELEIRLEELEKDWHFSSLEKIFFEERIYRQLENDARTWEKQLKDILGALLEFQDRLRRPITAEDVDRLVEKPVRKISKFDIKKANEHIKSLDEEMSQIEHHLSHLTEYAIDYFKGLKQKYGAGRERKTELIGFETIEAKKVAIANAKLFVNRAEGFIGTDLKRDENAEFVCDCSDLDDIIVFLKSGKYMVTKISTKAFVGKDIIYAGVFKSNDERTIYNTVYRNGKLGFYYVKRFAVNRISRDKEYDLSQGEADSQVVWFTVNPNGEAGIIKIFLRLRTQLKKPIFEFNFANLAIKGRSARGNVLTKSPIQKITLKDKGIATLGGQKIWFDADIQRLNTDERGLYLGEFSNGDHILTINKNGLFSTTNFDLSNRYQSEIRHICQFDETQVFSILYFDGETQSYYIKRCRFEVSDNQEQRFISEAPGSYFIDLSTDDYPQLQITFGGKHQNREKEILDVASFIGDKSFRAKGKRTTNYTVDQVCFIEPLQKDENEDAPDSGEDPEISKESIDQNADIQELDLGFELDGDPEYGASLPNPSPNKTEDSGKRHNDDAIQMTLI